MGYHYELHVATLFHWGYHFFTNLVVSCSLACILTTLHMIFDVTMVSFRKTPFMNMWTNIVMDDGCVHALAKTLLSLVNNLWWTIVMDDWNLDEKRLGKWQQLQHCKLITPQKIWQWMTNDVVLTFSVGNTTPWFIISIEEDDQYWWH